MNRLLLFSLLLLSAGVVSNCQQRDFDIAGAKLQAQISLSSPDSTRPLILAWVEGENGTNGFSGVSNAGTTDSIRIRYTAEISQGTDRLVFFTPLQTLPAGTVITDSLFLTFFSGAKFNRKDTGKGYLLFGYRGNTYQSESNVAGTSVPFTITNVSRSNDPISGSPVVKCRISYNLPVTRQGQTGFRMGGNAVVEFRKP
jgi:hypothetical protein